MLIEFKYFFNQFYLFIQNNENMEESFSSNHIYMYLKVKSFGFKFSDFGFIIKKNVMFFLSHLFFFKKNEKKEEKISKQLI